MQAQYEDPIKRKIKHLHGFVSEVIVAVPISAFYQPPPPVIFKADHPFLFLLTVTLDRKEDEFYSNDVILFMGKVNTPETV